MMDYSIFTISFRNFLRQKRRNILLGIAMAFGIMVLTVSNSFSKGISVNLLDRLIVHMAGHIKISMVEKSRIMTPVIRNKAWMLDQIQATVPDIKSIEESLGTMARAVGNGKSDYIYIVGVKLDEGFKSYFKPLEGTFKDYESNKYQNPLIISEQKAKYLKVKVGDQLSIRFQNINGQQDTAMVTVALIIKSENMFMDYALFMPLDHVKKIMGYQPWETGALQITLKNDPKKNSVKYANILHQKLKPNPAYIQGIANQHQVLILPFEKAISQNVLTQYLAFQPNGFNVDSKGVLISSSLAQKLGKKPGDLIQIIYSTQFKKEPAEWSLPIAAMTQIKNTSIPSDIIFVNSDLFFDQYNYDYPQINTPLTKLMTLDPKSLFWTQIAGEWKLLDRTEDTKNFYKKWKNILQNKQSQPILDITSMYENASQILQTESAFNLIMLVAGVILFSMIMVGVLNSLRMMVRERTREIGTMRAIGLKQSAVRNIFILETIYLAFFSWLAGLILAIIVMNLLSLIQFGSDNPLNILMVDRHLYFVTTFGNISQNFLVIMVMSIITAYFPARAAARLKPAEAFRHMN